MIEVVLRNNIHTAAATCFGSARWYQDVLKSEGDAIFPAKVAADSSLTQRFYRNGVPPYNKRTVWMNGQKEQLKHWRSQSEARLDEILGRLSQGGKSQSPDQIVAHAMFGFWLGILGPTFESTINPMAMWPRCLAATFPNNPHMTRARAHQLLLRVQGLRNRVSHHEPAWRLSTPLTPAGVNSTLTFWVTEMRELLNAMAPDVEQLLGNTGLFDRLEWLLDPRTIGAFAGQHRVSAVDFRALSRKVRRLGQQVHRRVFVSLPRPDKAMAVHHAGKRIMTVLPHC